VNTSWMKPSAAFFAGSLLLVACATDEHGNRQPLTETQAGVAIGAAVADKSAKGALIGAVGGGLVGGLVGH